MAEKNAKGEVFFFLHTAWDIEKADKILERKPREAEIVDVTDAQSMVSLEGEPHKFGGIRVNLEAAKKADISYPIYIATWRMRRGQEPVHLVIDGWHRIAKAKSDGIHELPAYIFDLKESKRIQIR